MQSTHVSKGRWRSRRLGLREVAPTRGKFSYALSAFICLSACSSPEIEEAVATSREYTGTPVASYSDSSGLWRILDKRDESRLTISPSLSRSIGAAFGPEVTFVPPTPQETQRTAQNWLASRGRPCSITGGQLLISPQWEFTYSCRENTAQLSVK